MFKREIGIYYEQWINPVEGIITSCFGERMNPIMNKKEFHNGIDIGAEQGEDIVAVKSGKILHVGISSTYGNVVEYIIEGGYIIKYAHCNEIFVKEGDRVEQGQIIASIGNTGLSTGSHLHYGISKNGIDIDPMDYVQLPVLEEALE